MLAHADEKGEGAGVRKLFLMTLGAVPQNHAVPQDGAWEGQ